MDPIRQLSNIETITTGAMEWLVDWDEAGWGWEEETVSGAETDTPQFHKKRIPVHVLYAKPRASQTLLEDSGINVSDWIAKKVADRFNRGESAAFVTGNGVGKPRGFTTYGDGTTYGTVERVNMGHATALVADGFYDLLMVL
jgi:HK97 family phage major capsid protein